MTAIIFTFKLCLKLYVSKIFFALGFEGRRVTRIFVEKDDCPKSLFSIFKKSKGL